MEFVELTRADPKDAWHRLREMCQQYKLHVANTKAMMRQHDPLGYKRIAYGSQITEARRQHVIKLWTHDPDGVMAFILEWRGASAIEKVKIMEAESDLPLEERSLLQSMSQDEAMRLVARIGVRAKMAAQEKKRREPRDKKYDDPLLCPIPGCPLPPSKGSFRGTRMVKHMSHVHNLGLGKIAELLPCLHDLVRSLDRYKCPRCSGENVDLRDLRKHLKSVHKLSDKQIVAEAEAAKTTRHPSLLRGGKFRCPVSRCDRQENGFPKRHNLRLHLAKHHKFDSEKVAALCPRLKGRGTAGEKLREVMRDASTFGIFHSEDDSEDDSDDDMPLAEDEELGYLHDDSGSGQWERQNMGTKMESNTREEFATPLQPISANIVKAKPAPSVRPGSGPDCVPRTEVKHQGQLRPGMRQPSTVRASGVGPLRQTTLTSFFEAKKT